MNISIKRRIYLSFLLLVGLFVLNGIVTILTLISNKKLAISIFKVIDPTIQSLDDLEKIMLESKMYTTNWVFLSSNIEDEKSLKEFHDSDYIALKSRINGYTSQWLDINWNDSLSRIYTRFEELLAIERNITGSLNEVTDDDEPVIRLEAERKVEEEIFPRTAALMNSLKTITDFAIVAREEKGVNLERSSMKLRLLIIALTITIIIAGFLLSIYMTKVIIKPVNKISLLINDLGKGIIRKADHHTNGDEIGKMVLSVNNLSEKLEATAKFAQQVGLRNFDIPFKPLSNEDTLGLALITMRDNIKSADEKLNQAQQISHIGSWERDMATDKLTLSDEMFCILDIDPLSFDFLFPSILKLVHPDDMEYALDIMQKNTYMTPVPFECRIVTSKGVIKNMLIETKLKLGNRGEIQKAFGIVQDITERKKSEEQVKLSNERYELVTKTTNEMIWDWDLVKNKIFRNENYYKIFGDDGGDRNVVEKWMQCVHHEDKQRVSDFMQKKLEDPGAASWENEFRCYKYNGEIVYLYDRGYIIRDENKKAIRMVGAASDITERKIAELALIESEKYNRNLFDQSPVGLALSRMDGTLEDVNEAYAKITGRTIEECKKLSYFEITPEKYSAEESERLSELELTGRYGPYEKEYIHKDGHLVPVRLSGIILEKNGVHYIWSSVEDITENKKAELSNKFKAELLNTVGQAVISTDKNGFVNFWNKASEEIYGWTAMEAIGKNIVDLTPAYTSKEQAIEIMHELSHGRSWSGEFVVQRKSGDTFPAFVTTSPVYDQHQGVSGIIGVSSDITERKKTEEALSNNELRFRTLTDNAPVGIFQTDMDGKTIFVNETFLEYTGMSFEESMGDGWIEAIHPADREAILNEWKENSEKGIESSSEYRLIDKKGDIKWVIGNAVPINKSGEISGYIGTLSDITQRKLAIESLQQSEIKYRQIVETAQEGIWLIDENNYTTFVNKKMAELLEYSPEEMTGKANYSFMNDEWKKKASEHNVSRKLGISETYDFKYITKSGKDVWTSLSTNPVFDDAGTYKGALAMVTDITKRKYDEEQLQKSEVKLVLKNKELEEKNKELEQFAYVASHDLQEPLRTTSSFVELFQQQYQGKLDEKADKYLDYIVQASERMRAFLIDLLEYSRIGSKKELKKVNCNIVLNEVLADLNTAINEADAEIETGPLPVISGYQTEIKQLFQNLAFNAIKFRQKNIAPRIKITARREKDNWQFAFTDNGIGIAKEHYERIFVIFQRLHTRNEFKGSGIGLSHCKKIVELHKGKIWLESELGKGTTFYFTIPQKNNN